MREKDQKANNGFRRRIRGLWQKTGRAAAGVKTWTAKHRSQLKTGFKGAAILALVLVLVTTVGIYGLGWQNGLAKAVSYVVPYPAARVDGESISYNRYIRTLDYLNGTINADASSTTGADLSDHAMALLVNQKITADAARERGVSFSEAEVEEYFQATLARNPSAEQNGGQGVDQGMMRRQVESSLLAYKLEQALRDAGELEEDQTWNDWLLQAGEDRDVRYLLPQHGR